MYLKSSLDDVENLVFFDIDQTLSTSITHAFYSVDKIIAYDQELKSRGIKRAKAIDAIYLNEVSLLLFSELMKVKGTKAICISSWVATSKKDEIIDEITSLFNDHADFPKDWLIGFVSGGSGDRMTNAVLPFMEKYNYKKNFVVIDDSADRFSMREKTVRVDGRISFQIYDFVKACDILGISEIDNEILNYHLQYIRKEQLDDN